MTVLGSPGNRKESDIPVLEGSTISVSSREE